MHSVIGTRIQVALVVLLFVGSLSVLMFNIVPAFQRPGDESELRDRLRSASARMAKAADALLRDGIGERSTNELDKVLRAGTTRALADSPETEGGYYLAGVDRFVAFAFPTKDPAPKGDRNDPPPMEAPYIRVQARQSLALPPGEFLYSARAVGPSRVAFVTEPVGTARPAAIVTWVMTRVSGPEQLERKATSYAVSSGLALTSVLAALILAWNLRRTLIRQRADQERLREELRKSENLAALGRLLAGVAHEVRNPLAGIRSTVQLWQRLPDRALTPESIEAVIRAVDRLDETVSRLLHFSRADRSERHSVDMNRLVTESLQLIAAQADSQKVSVQFEPGSDPMTVSGSDNALREVVLNLLTNALQTMPEGGRLRCTIRRNNEAIELRVEDSGPGVSAADRPHLFEPFFTTRPEGTGLGLALCREIVSGHRGTIDVESTGAGGSVFLVVLPFEP
jgi:two-component system, NtrC family, sensor histidine kinase HydH